MASLHESNERITLVILIWFLILGSTPSCFAQKSLLFQKNKNKEVVYEPGDVISFRLKGDKSKHTFQIMRFEDSLIVFKNYKVNPKEITHMYRDTKNKTWWFMKYKWSGLCFIVGIGYLVLDGLHLGELTRETLIFSGSLIAAGVLTKLIINDRIKIRGSRKLVVIR